MMGLYGTGDFKTPFDDRACQVPRTVLRRLWDSRPYQGCPTSPRLRRTNSLSSPGMSKEFYVQTGAEAEALALADINQPRGAGGECFHIGAFGHEEQLVEGDRREV